jgi:TusA-related sulfurtransferase
MTTSNVERVIEHNIRGQICPSTLLFTLREINKVQQELKEGLVRIVIFTDNRNAIATIPEAVASMGYGTTIEKKEGFYQIEIRGRGKTSK